MDKLTHAWRWGIFIHWTESELSKFFNEALPLIKRNPIERGEDPGFVRGMQTRGRGKKVKKVCVNSTAQKVLLLSLRFVVFGFIKRRVDHSGERKKMALKCGDM
jgi:hypothetical protein